MRSKRSPKSKIRDVLFGVLTLVVFIPTNAFAQTMPWENPLRQLLSSLQGPTAQIIIIMAMIASRFVKSEESEEIKLVFVNLRKPSN